jgi:hypothetical protein
MTQVSVAYFNYEHGGVIDCHCHAYSSEGGYDLPGLVRVAGDGGRWPHILSVGDGDRHELAGGKGVWEAAAAMREHRVTSALRFTSILARPPAAAAAHHHNVKDPRLGSSLGRTLAKGASPTLRRRRLAGRFISLPAAMPTRFDLEWSPMENQPSEDRLGGRIDTRVPHSARVWNYWAGGQDHYPVDQQAGDESLALFPGLADTILALRYFSSRVVRRLAADDDVRQFLDIGSGMPHWDPVHQVAQDAAPSVVVYADNDLLTLRHAEATLAGPPGSIGCVHADLNDPVALVERASQFLDFARPVAILLMSTLGHIGDPDKRDDEDAWLVTEQLKATLAPGGYLAIGDLVSAPALNDAMEAYRATGAAPYRLRSPSEIEELLDGLEVTAPGFTPVSRWQPEHSPFPHPDVPAWGGIWRKR